MRQRIILPATPYIPMISAEPALLKLTGIVL